MKKILSKIKDHFAGKPEDEDANELEEEYVELGPSVQPEDGESKIIVRPFVIEDFTDIKEILNALRDGYTIAIINIKPLKEKDIIELKRAINKLKKTCDAIKGDIAGFGDDYIICSPAFAEIYRAKEVKSPDAALKGR
jgi:SepF-like predicted cell division protein (DUF552 family)